MLTVLYLALAASVLVIAVSIAVLASGLLCEARKLGKTSEDVSAFLKATEDELTETAQHARNALLDTDRLVLEITDAIKHVDKAALGIERLVDGAQAATSAFKLVKSSTGGLMSAYEGIRQGVKTLWGSEDTDKEESK